MKTKGFFIFGILIFSLFSCQKDMKIESNVAFKENFGDDKFISDRSETECSPGQFVIENGVLKFTTEEDFFKTIDFLSCATPQEKDVWRNSFSLITAEKSYLNFISQIYSEEITEEELTNLLIEYEGKIKVLNGEDEESKYYEPLYFRYPEFQNMDGLFKIGERIEKETELYNLSVLDGDLTKLQYVLDNEGDSSDDPEIQALVIVDWNDGGGDCCPLTVSETERNGRYR